MIELIQYRWGSSRPDRRRSAKSTSFRPISGLNFQTEASNRQRIRENHFPQKHDCPEERRATDE